MWRNHHADRAGPRAGAAAATTESGDHARIRSATDSAPAAAAPGGAAVQVPPRRLEEALVRVLLMGRRPTREDASRFIEYAAAAGIPLDQCWALEQGGSYRAAALATPNPGRTALLFISPVHTPEEFEQVVGLVRHALANMDRRRIGLAQALLDRGERSQREAFLRAGFRHLADLAYLERLAPPPNHFEAPRWPDGSILETWSPENERDFGRAVLASYEETKDCPMLCGLRSIDDVMAGHRNSGRFDPLLWTLVRYRGEPAAALLLSPMPEQRMIELTYIGVGSRFRRMGLGRRLVIHGLRQASRRAERIITLAVDEANEPAVRLYRALGFHRAERRVALIAPLD